MSPSKCKFSQLRLLARKLTKLLMSFFKPRVSFSESPFSVMTHNSSVIFLVQTLYTLVKRSSIKWKFWDFRVLGQNSPHSTCYFSKRKSVPPQILHHSSVLWHITPLYFLAQTQYTFDKSSTSKCKFSDLPLLALKFTKFLMSFLEPRVSFSSNFASLFSVMRHNSSVLFHLKLYMLWTKGAHQSANFYNCDYSHEN